MNDIETILDGLGLKHWVSEKSSRMVSMRLRQLSTVYFYEDQITVWVFSALYDTRPIAEKYGL